MITRTRLAGYHLPSVQYDSDDGRRLAGLDVPGMSDREIYAEGTRLGAALAYAIATDYRGTLETCTAPYYIPVIEWLERRMRLVQAEIRKRKGSHR